MALRIEVVYEDTNKPFGPNVGTTWMILRINADPKYTTMLEAVVGINEYLRDKQKQKVVTGPSWFDPSGNVPRLERHVRSGQQVGVPCFYMDCTTSDL